jgi:Uma2 family endonuclease
MTTQTRVTPAEYEAFIARPEHAERRFELIDGEIIEKPMPTREHGTIASWISTFFNLYFMQHTHVTGNTAVEARHRPNDDALNSRMPDVSVVVGKRPITRRGTANYIPDICIEIQSPDDALKGLRDKAAFYLAHGAKYALVVRPEKRLIEVYSADEEIAILRADDALTFPDLLPGFTVEVSRLFPPSDQIADQETD